MANPKLLDETVTKLRDALQESSTLGWDVVVNYSVGPINKLLAETFKSTEHKHIRDLDFDVTILDDDDDDVTIHYHFELGAPLIQFNPRGAEGPTCNLSIPIVGGTVERKGKPDSTVPSDIYTLTLSDLVLATAEGHLDPNPDHSGKPFVLGGQGQQGCVVIDLPTSKKLRTEIQHESEGIKSIDRRIPDIQDSIKTQFLSGGAFQDVRIEIARINSLTPSPAYQLQPKSFRFHTFLRMETPEPDDVGVLSLFIQTRDANHGKQDSVGVPWENQWRETLQCSPIPVGETASILFSKDMMFESTVQPAVSANGFTVERSDDRHSLDLRIDSKITIDRPRQTNGSIEIRSVSEVHVVVPPFQVKFAENNSSGGIFLSWRYDYSLEWSRFFQPPGNHPPEAESGTVNVTNEIKERFTGSHLDDRRIMVDCSVSSSEWVVALAPKEPSLFERFFGVSGRLPDWAEIKINPPSFQLELADVDFFLTTNLLFPDDKQVIDVNKQAGLRIPGDFYLVGKVVDK